jgi:hypothetical protein
MVRRLAEAKGSGRDELKHACASFSGEKQKTALLSDESAFRWLFVYQPTQPFSIIFYLSYGTVYPTRHRKQKCRIR